MKPSNASVNAPAAWELEWRLIALLCENLGLHPSQVRPEVPFVDVVRGVDSLDVIELVAAMEEEFQVTLTDQWCQEVFTNHPARTVSELARVLVQLQQTGPLPAKPIPHEPAPVPERSPFLQMGGRLTEWDWLNGPLYQRLGSNRNGMTEYRRDTDGMRCIELPAEKVTPSSGPGGKGERVSVQSFLIDAEPVANLAFARFLNSIGTVPPSILLEWCGTTGDDHRGAQFGLKQGRWWFLWRWWAPLWNTGRQPMILVSWYGAAAWIRSGPIVSIGGIIEGTARSRPSWPGCASRLHRRPSRACVCPPSWSGNTPPGDRNRSAIPGETPSRLRSCCAWPSIDRASNTAPKRCQPLPSAIGWGCRRSVCTTWPAMSGNGAGTGIVPARLRLRPRSRPASAASAAAAGSARPGWRSAATAEADRQWLAAAAWAFAVWGPLSKFDH